MLKGSELTLRVSGSGHSKEATEAMTKNLWKRTVCEVTRREGVDPSECCGLRGGNLLPLQRHLGAAKPRNKAPLSYFSNKGDQMLDRRCQ